jgi:hypothetical protein
MRLAYLRANQAWVFLFGDTIVRMGDGPMFHVDRGAAVLDALAHGLRVSTRGNVSVVRA